MCCMKLIMSNKTKTLKVPARSPTPMTPIVCADVLLSVADVRRRNVDDNLDLLTLNSIFQAFTISVISIVVK